MLEQKTALRNSLSCDFCTALCTALSTGLLHEKWGKVDQDTLSAWKVAVLNQRLTPPVGVFGASACSSGHRDVPVHGLGV